MAFVSEGGFGDVKKTGLSEKIVKVFNEVFGFATITADLLKYSSNRELQNQYLEMMESEVIILQNNRNTNKITHAEFEYQMVEMSMRVRCFCNCCSIIIDNNREFPLLSSQMLKVHQLGSTYGLKSSFFQTHWQNDWRRN